MLTRDVESYIAIRRAVGFDLRNVSTLLRAFAKFAAGRGETHIRTRTAIEWAGRSSSPAQRARRLGAVVRFARYVRNEDDRHELPPDHVFGRHRTRPLPFLFTAVQIEALVKEAACLDPCGSSRPLTLSTLFALLAVTGLRVSEALALRLGDVTGDGLVIREAKFHKSRLVPLHESTTKALERYLVHHRPRGADDHVFLTDRARALQYHSAWWAFRTIRRRLDLPARARIHSLRHTFAVRALEAGPDSGGRIAEHMLAVSTYLGHARVADTYWYLQSTPRLLEAVADVAERYWKGGTP